MSNSNNQISQQRNLYKTAVNNRQIKTHSSNPVSRRRDRDGGEQTKKTENLPQICTCVGYHIHREQAHKLSRLNRHVRVHSATLWQHQLTRSESINLTQILLFCVGHAGNHPKLEFESEIIYLQFHYCFYSRIADQASYPKISDSDLLLMRPNSCQFVPLV